MKIVRLEIVFNDDVDIELKKEQIAESVMSPQYPDQFFDEIHEKTIKFSTIIIDLAENGH